jgi:hypothetical protein
MHGRLAFVIAGACAAAAPARAERWVDKPAWPDKATKATIRWVVHPAPVPDEDSLPKRPMTFELTIGDVTRVVVLAPQSGRLDRDHQPSCAKVGTNAFPLRTDEVGKITFYLAGFGGFVVRRDGDALAVIAWEEEDGACASPHGRLVVCPRRDTVIAKLHVPEGLALTEKIVELDAKGVRHAFDCTAARP